MQKIRYASSRRRFLFDEKHPKYFLVNTGFEPPGNIPLLLYYIDLTKKILEVSNNLPVLISCILNFSIPNEKIF